MSKSWVKLQIEPVEVVVDGDGHTEGSLLFSTVQSVVPGAHGLYYRENGQRKALGFDTNTGRVFAPPLGWTAQNVYIHLAHGHKHGSHYADYSKASAQFERNISAVQKLIAAAGLSAGFRPTLRGKDGRSRSKVKSGFEAQPENVNISDESDTVSPTIESQVDVKQLLAEKEDLRLQLKDLKSQLRDAQKENKELKQQQKAEVIIPHNLPADQSFTESEATLDGTKAEESNKLEMLEAIQQEQANLLRSKDEQIASLQAQLEAVKSKAQDLTDKEEEINNLHSVIEDLREKLNSSQKESQEWSSSLGEHKELLKNAKDKVSFLENQVAALNGSDFTFSPTTTVAGRRSRQASESADEPGKPLSRSGSIEAKIQAANSALRQVEADKQKLQEANWYANERVGKLEKEISYLKGSNEEMRNRLASCSDAKLLAEKDRMICEMAEQRAKLEWRLGELNQWWNDSKWKIGELEAGVAHQKYLLDTASAKIQSLNDQLVIALRAPPTIITAPPQNNFAVRQDYTGHWQLSNAGPIPTMPALPPPAFPYAQNPYFTQPTSSFDTRKVKIEVENPDNKEVYLLSSFLNWQCALRCDLHQDGKSAVVVDVPRGRHEFRFLKSNEWMTSSNYATVPNGLGGYNNLLIVE